MRLFVSPPSWTTRKNRGARPRASIDLSPFLSIMVVLLFIVMFGNMYPIHRHQTPADMPLTEHSTLQPAALRDDALEVGITRDGTVYFHNHRILPANLPDALREAARNGAQKTVYIKVDAHAKYLDVKTVLDEVRQSGLQDIAFLTEQPAH